MLSAVPLMLAEANAFVTTHHRHHKPVVGCRFVFGVQDGDRLCGAVIAGRPVARKTDSHTVLEVTRLVTDGTKNACSFLYAAVCRIARDMGYKRVQTFILESEPGTSLKAAGFSFDGLSAGKTGWKTRPGRRTDQPVCVKQRWIRVL